MTLALWREAWGCDCDGVRREAIIRGPHACGLHAHLDAMERITQQPSPRGCPWRSYYDPLVREVVRLAAFYDSGNLAAVLTDRTPAVVVDGLAVFRSAQQAVFDEERRIRDAERDAKKPR